MTPTERYRVTEFLAGRGWVRLTDMRSQIGWPSRGTELITCINALARQGVIVTTKRGELGFRVCLASEAVKLEAAT